MEVLYYCGYDINRYFFYIKGYDDKSTLQNSKVTLVAQVINSLLPKIEPYMCKDVILQGHQRYMGTLVQHVQGTVF